MFGFSDEKIITKSSLQGRLEAESRSFKRKNNRTCPCCEDDGLRFGVTDGKYNYYKCDKCYCEWKVRK